MQLGHATPEDWRALTIPSLAPWCSRSLWAASKKDNFFFASTVLCCLPMAAELHFGLPCLAKRACFVFKLSLGKSVMGASKIQRAATSAVVPAGHKEDSGCCCPAALASAKSCLRWLRFFVQHFSHLGRLEPHCVFEKLSLGSGCEHWTQLLTHTLALFACGVEQQAMHLEAVPFSHCVLDYWSRGFSISQAAQTLPDKALRRNLSSTGRHARHTPSFCSHCVWENRSLFLFALHWWP